MRVIAHRGVPAQAPPNTLAGLRRAIALGLDYAGLDLRTTSDGKIVDLHEATLDATTDGHGEVASKTCAELRRLDAGAHFGAEFSGERVLLLAEELALAKGRIKLFLDLKDARPLQALWLLEQFDSLGEVVCSGPAEMLAAMMQANRRAPVAPLLEQPEQMPRLADRFEAKQVIGATLDEAAVAAAHAHGAEYILDLRGAEITPDRIRRCLGAGVDALLTDDAVAALEALKRAGAGPPAPSPAPEPPPIPGPRRDTRRVRIIVHRGVLQRAPQNTLPAARGAIALGADFVEVDLQTTADGLLVDMHNDSVDRTTNGHGLVRELRYAEIRALDAGSWFAPEFAGTPVPLIGEVLALAKDRAGVYLDWKEADPRPVVHLLQAFDMTREALVHADEEVCREVRALDPTVVLMPGANGADEVRRLAASLHPQAVEVRWRWFTDEAAQACRDAGMVCATSLAGGRGDTPEEMRRAVTAGAELIETDEPEMLLEVLASL